jgi:hypothetical protein
VVGEVPSAGGKSYYLSKGNGDLTIVPMAAAPGVSLALDLGVATTTTIQLPQLQAGRIYLSIAKPLLVTATAPGAPPSAPPGWVPTDPNFNTYFDFAEFTWLDDSPPSTFASTWGGNVTQVDMFGFPLYLVLRGKKDDGTVIVRRAGFTGDTVRSQIFQQLWQAGNPWRKLIMGDTRRSQLRIVAPYHGIEMGVFPANFLDAYISQVWQTYTSQALVGQTQDRIYSGTVVNNELVFNQTGGPGADPPFKFKKPTTKDAFENSMPPIPNPLTPEGDRARAIGALLSGGMMRTTLVQLSNLKDCRTQFFYVNAPINVYAKAFHQFGVGHLAYSFGFDDTCEQSSFIQIHDPEALSITIGKF